MPDIILFIVSGYLFIHVFNFVSTIDNPKDYQHIFVNSLVIGFVLKNSISLIPLRFANHYINIIGFLGICVCAAYLVAKIYTYPKIENLFRYIGIKRTLNQYIWKDIEDYDKPLWVRVLCKSIGRIYHGKLVLMEDFERKPQIVLSQFSEKDLDGNIIEDNIDKEHRRILIDTEQCDKIEFIYFKESKYLQISDDNVFGLFKKRESDQQKADQKELQDTLSK